MYVVREELVDSCDSYTRSISCSERAPFRPSTDFWIAFPLLPSSTSPPLVFRMAGKLQVTDMR